MNHNQSHHLQRVIDELTAHHLPGKAKPLRLALTALLTGGHILIEDIPGLGKTTLAIALANSLGLSFGRVQCTSDLLPADITGLTIFDRQENSFRFVKGPVFNNILLVDEINRAMPKTQSALLEAMEEHRVTADGVTYPLPDPFLVIATQNPAEQVGTYPLPESQMDRFLIRTGMGYPAAEIEKEIIRYGSIRHDIRHHCADGHAGRDRRRHQVRCRCHLPVGKTRRLHLQHCRRHQKSPPDSDRHFDPWRHQSCPGGQGTCLP